MKIFALIDAPEGAKKTEFCASLEALCEKNRSSVEYLRLSGGGEGFVERFTAFSGGDILMCRVTDPNFFIKNVRYGVKDDIAIVGAAECCGLKNTMIKNPLYATSYGLGECISLAKKLGKKRVFVGLGDSAANDGGAGIICALGGKFFDKNGEEFTPVGETLVDIERVDFSGLYDNIEGLKFTVLTDNKCTLFGDSGCCRLTAPKKGAKEEEIAVLEDNLRVFVEKCGKERADFDGAGASGGIGYCFKAIFGAELFGCRDYMLDGLFDGISDADAVVSFGEEKTALKVKNMAEDAGKKFAFIGENCSEEDLQKIFEKR